VKDTIFPSNFALNCKGILHEFAEPQIMGIINATPDSFYSSSRKPTIEKGLTTAQEMLEAGAQLLDIGGYSSRPGALDIGIQEEIDRTSGLIEAIKKSFPTCLISIDTFRSAVAESALNVGADLVNDISAGKLDSKIFEVAAKHNSPYIMMHMRGNPRTMDKLVTYENLVTDILSDIRIQTKKAIEAGVKDIIIDPGFGFSKTIAQNYEILKKLELFKLLEFPILVGLSRKSMLYKTLNITAEQALNATTVANTIALENGANILRVHDVKAAFEAVQLMKALNS
jgi:dihydropteroate synthase